MKVFHLKHEFQVVCCFNVSHIFALCIGLILDLLSFLSEQMTCLFVLVALHRCQDPCFSERVLTLFMKNPNVSNRVPVTSSG